MKITIVGCGNMGLVYAHAFIKYNIVSRENLLLVEKNENRKKELEKLNIGIVVTQTDLKIKESEVVIIAVKPQDFNELAIELKAQLNPNSLYISIMAGVKMERIENLLGVKNIIRAMPNSPVELGMGLTGYTTNGSGSHAMLLKAEQLLSTTGRSIYFEDENMLDSVTALSGSGPAYFFYIVKSMIEAGKQMGMDESVSAILVKQTMLGAFHLINNANKSLDDLIKTVASKGGTTEAALKTFEEASVAENLIKGILAAEKRSQELSK